MQTPEQIEKIKRGLRCCAADECRGADGRCPYFRTDATCVKEIATDALACIDDLETAVKLMRVQMRGDCGVCKHSAEKDLCARCVNRKGERTAWEYEGLPEVGK